MAQPLQGKKAEEQASTVWADITVVQIWVSCPRGFTYLRAPGTEVSGRRVAHGCVCCRLWLVAPCPVLLVQVTFPLQSWGPKAPPF